MFAVQQDRDFNVASRLPKQGVTSLAYNTNQTNQLDAVIIRNLSYEIGRGRGKKLILNKINLTVPEGSIYGLLGPSGCGKTTMLRCVVGRIRARSGQVLVFGCRPGEGLSEVPGRDVGYMPQDISIYEDFTIEETLRYFGKINRIPDIEIKKRIDFLLRFLDLPPKSRLVVNLSGGQKRRVSLAATLVHSPPLLILDEPTVGVDPLLRQSIWKHLVTLTQTERISVIITTHYIEEARQANVVGLMRHGKILAENSPDELMHMHHLYNLEDVFLKLCMTDSSRRAASMATAANSPTDAESKTPDSAEQRQLEVNLFTRPTLKGTSDSSSSELHNRAHRSRRSHKDKAHIRIHTGTNRIELKQVAPMRASYTNEAIEDFSSEDDLGDDEEIIEEQASSESSRDLGHDRVDQTNFKKLIQRANYQTSSSSTDATTAKMLPPPSAGAPSEPMSSDDYLALQAMRWAARRTGAYNNIMINLRLARNYGSGDRGQRHYERNNYLTHKGRGPNNISQWMRTLWAVTWKNYIRLRRNPPVLVFQFMLPAIQVILFCLCIGGEPFDVPVAIVNDELVPRSSIQFLEGLDKKVIRQVKYDNLTSAIEAVRRGKVWGVVHIPDKYSQHLQSRLIMGEEVNSATISNGTIRVYPDLTNLHLALALENTFRETFLSFARNSLEEMGYDRSLASLPIQVGKPVYGTMRKDGYLEFMAPGVVISISYVMATGLTALAFILERRDGLLERSLVSGVQTSQILLAHAINQVVVMVIQIFLVLGCTFFVFEIPSRGPFFWVVLLILLQGCTGMGFGLLVSAICKEENTAVMMVVGTFYTNLILAGIIWPIEAMPHWIRPLSYAQPQTLPTDTLRHILSRGWGITEPGVLLGFAVTIGWLAIFLMAAGLIFKYSK